MANPKIEVEIGAKTQGLRSGVNLAEKELNNLGRAAQQTSPKVNNLSQSISGANGVGIEFSRIIQDAPFGIIGVGNNITQLAGSFSNLQKQTGSAGKALKVAFQSIISPANLVVLGVSAVTTALTLYNMGAFKSKEETRDLTAELEKYRGTLESVARANLEGQGNAQKELATLEALRVQASNVNVSLENRKAAVSELQRLYPDYLGNLSEEQILSGNLGDSYKDLTASLIATAKARASVNKIAENGLSILTLETQAQENALRIAELREAQVFARERDLKARQQGVFAASEENRIQRQIDDLIETQVSLFNDRNKLSEENLRLQSNVTSLIESGATFTKSQKNDLQEQVVILDEVKRKYQEIINVPTLTPQLDLPNVQGVNLESPTSFFGELFTALDQNLLSFEDRLAQFAFRAQDLLNNGVGNTIGDFAFSIGEAIASGGNALQAGGAALLGGLASILNQLGQLAIGTGLAIAGIKKALLSLNPVLAIGAGTALIALAGAVSAGAKKLGGSIGGGIGSIGSSGVGGASAQTFAGSGAGLDLNRSLALTGEFRINGRDLVYIIDESRSQNASG